MTNYVPHPAIVYNIPLQTGAEVLRPETAILRFSNGSSLDIGALCYLRREIIIRKHRYKDKGRSVDLNSLDTARTELVRKLIKHISDNLTRGGQRVSTVYGNAMRFIQFLSWSDANGYADALTGEQQARSAVRAFAVYLREQVNSNCISVNTGAQLQSTAFAFLAEFLEIDNLDQGLNLLRKQPSSIESTVPPSEDLQSKVLALCESLFTGLSELTLKNKPYPYWLNMPKYLGFPNNGLWVFPTNSWCMPPHIIATRHMLNDPAWAYDYKNGRLATLSEILASRTRNHNTHRDFRTAQSQIYMANANPQCSSRRQAADRALNAFMQLFLAQTGMNASQMTDLPWNNQYEVKTIHQQFRTIKYRAGGREVYFELPISFMALFKKYLALREYLLNGQECSLLFFKMGSKATGIPKKIYSLSGYSRLFYKSLQHFDPHLLNVNPRKWRAAKSDWLIRNADPAVTALVLQNSERTVLKSYTAGSETTHLEEMTKFLEKVTQTVIAKGEKIEGEVSRATGVCSAYGAPNQVSRGVAIQPDCKGPEGCLFCDKFKVHADERDTRKLLSCRYCIQQTAHLFGGEDRFESVLGPVLSRIQQILDEIAHRDPTLVTRITREVEMNGELDDYWAQKLQMLIDLEWVS